MKTLTHSAKSILEIAIIGVFIYTGIALAQDKIPDDWMPWNDPKTPNAIRLNDDGSKDAYIMHSDTSECSKRDPGLVNPQRR